MRHVKRLEGIIINKSENFSSNNTVLGNGVKGNGRE